MWHIAHSPVLLEENGGGKRETAWDAPGASMESSPRLPLSPPSASDCETSTLNFRRLEATHSKQPTSPIRSGYTSLQHNINCMEIACTGSRTQPDVLRLSSLTSLHQSRVGFILLQGNSELDLQMLWYSRCAEIQGQLPFFLCIQKLYTSCYGGHIWSTP